MVSGNHLNGYVNKAVGRYSSLFTLPSQNKLLLFLLILCTVGGSSAFFLLDPTYLALGFLFGASFFFFTLLADVVTSYVLKKDLIFNFRRCSALSLFSCLVWFFLIFIGSVISFFFRDGRIWVNFFLLGFCATLILRLFVFSTVSFGDRGRVILSSFLQPLFCNILLLLTGRVVGYKVDTQSILFLLISIPVTLLAVLIFITFVNRIGEEHVGISSLTLFKAFLANWTEDLNTPLEILFEKLGNEQNIKLSLMAFRGNKELKAIMVVPTFHPGPFKNVGSSSLPYMIQTELENSLQCIASVPHGLSGHELNLTSQLQNEKVMHSLRSLNFSNFYPSMTPLVRVNIKGANAGCQIFGDCAFVTLTSAPNTMEDLPQELDPTIVNEAKKYGLASAIIVDAHNSIEGPFNLKDAVKNFGNAVRSGLEKAASLQRFPFELGSVKIVPKEFSVKEGMGPGGITMLIFRVDNQKIAYVTIDGNNMISGLREKILRALQEIGITDGEIFTTDTHMVNGVALTKRGYHPIGEAIDQMKLINYIRQAAITATGKLEPAEISWRNVTIPNVKVMGKKQIETLLFTIEEAAKLSKKLAVSIFTIIGFIFTALLVVL